MPLVANGTQEVSEGEVRTELARILASGPFGRSPRSQQFLQYVCDLTLRGQASRINQYLIGSEVFKRGPDYSTDEDSLVRRQAHALRQKLDAYYAHEGYADPVRIELPVGQYVPIFHKRTVEEQQSTPPKRPPNRMFVLVFIAASGLFLLVAGWSLGRHASRSQLHSAFHPAAREIWRGWLSNSEGPVICLSNPMTVNVKYSLESSAPEDMLDVLPGQDKVLRQFFSLPGTGHLFIFPSRANTKVGEALGSAMLAAFFSRASLPVRMTQSRLLSWEDLRAHDFVLFGHNEANTWLDPLLTKYPFRLHLSGTARKRLIVNTSPKPGEAAEYAVELNEDQNLPTREYALISMLPGLDSRRRLLLISGLNTQATRVATELLTESDHVERLYRELREAAPAHRGNWFFQAIVRAEVRDKIATAEPEIVAIRIL